MPGTNIYDVPESEVTLRWRQPYVSAGLNQSATNQGRGIVRGFILEQANPPAPNVFQISPDPITEDSVCNGIGRPPVQGATDWAEYSLTFRSRSSILIDLSALSPPNAGEQYFIGFVPNYLTGQETQSQIRAYTRAQYVADEMNEDGAILLGAVWGGDLGDLTNDFISFSGTCMNAAAGNWDKSATPYWRQLAQHWGNGSDGVGSEVILYNNTFSNNDIASIAPDFLTFSVSDPNTAVKFMGSSTGTNNVPSGNGKLVFDYGVTTNGPTTEIKTSHFDLFSSGDGIDAFRRIRVEYVFRTSGIDSNSWRGFQGGTTKQNLWVIDNAGGETELALAGAMTTLTPWYQPFDTDGEWGIVVAEYYVGNLDPADAVCAYFNLSFATPGEAANGELWFDRITVVGLKQPTAGENSRLVDNVLPSQRGWPSSPSLLNPAMPRTGVSQHIAATGLAVKNMNVGGATQKGDAVGNRQLQTYGGGFFYGTNFEVGVNPYTGRMQHQAGVTFAPSAGAVNEVQNFAVDSSELRVGRSWSNNPGQPGTLPVDTTDPTMPSGNPQPCDLVVSNPDLGQAGTNLNPDTPGISGVYVEGYGTVSTRFRSYVPTLGLTPQANGLTPSQTAFWNPVFTAVDPTVQNNRSVPFSFASDASVTTGTNLFDGTEGGQLDEFRFGSRESMLTATEPQIGINNTGNYGPRAGVRDVERGSFAVTQAKAWDMGGDNQGRLATRIEAVNTPVASVLVTFGDPVQRSTCDVSATDFYVAAVKSSIIDDDWADNLGGQGGIFWYNVTGVPGDVGYNSSGPFVFAVKTWVDAKRLGIQPSPLIPPYFTASASLGFNNGSYLGTGGDLSGWFGMNRMCTPMSWVTATVDSANDTYGLTIYFAFYSQIGLGSVTAGQPYAYGTGQLPEYRLYSGPLTDGSDIGANPYENQVALALNVWGMSRSSH